jgi:hypothetical protein
VRGGKREREKGGLDRLLPGAVVRKLGQVHIWQRRDWRRKEKSEGRKKEGGKRGQIRPGNKKINTAKKDICGPYHSLNNFVYLLKIQGKN